MGAGSFDTTGDVSDVELIVPKENEHGKLFAGAGTYTLGGTGRLTPFGGVFYYGSQPYFFVRYTSPMYTPPAAGPSSGVVRLTHYDAQQGTAAGTFEFEARWQSGTAVPGAPVNAVVTNGDFNVTF